MICNKHFDEILPCFVVFPGAAPTGATSNREGVRAMVPMVMVTKDTAVVPRVTSKPVTDSQTYTGRIARRGEGEGVAMATAATDTHKVMVTRSVWTGSTYRGVNVYDGTA